MASTADTGPDLGEQPEHRPTVDDRLTALDASLDRGTTDADGGRVIPADEVRARLIAKYEAMATPSARTE